MSFRLEASRPYLLEILSTRKKKDRLLLYKSITLEQIKSLFEIFVNLFGLGVDRNTCVKYSNSVLVKDFLKATNRRTIISTLKLNDKLLCSLLKEFLDLAVARANINTINYG